MFFPPLSFADIYLNKKKVFVHAFFHSSKKVRTTIFLVMESQEFSIATSL